MLASNPSVPIAVVAPARRRRPSAMRMAGRALLKDPFAIGASVVVLLVIFCALFGPQVVPYDPTDQEIAYRLRPPMWEDRGTASHPLGTDQLGRDILSRMVYGARVSVVVGLIVVFIGGFVGTALGIGAGFFGGKLEAAVIGTVDVILSFPGLLLALIIAATFGATIPTMILALSLRGWVVYARISRGQSLSLNQYQFVEAARCIGAPSYRILATHMLPNLMPSMVTVAVLELARVVLAESSLSFLGLGVQPPGISWGLMLAEGRNYMLTANWLVTLPGLAIAATVLGVNILASHVRRFVDPFQRGRGDSVSG